MFDRRAIACAVTLLVLAACASLPAPSTGAAPARSPLFITTVPQQVTSLASSAITGTTTNDNAPAGSVGEYVESNITVGMTLSSAIVANLTSISLTGGDWDVIFTACYGGDDTTTLNRTLTNISLVSANLNDTLGPMNQQVGYGMTTFYYGTVCSVISARRVSLASTTTVYAVVDASFAVSYMNVYGRISARRVR